MKLEADTDLDPVVGGRVRAKHDAHSEVTRSVLGAPNTGPTDPKQLLRGEAEAWQHWLLSVFRDPGFYKKVYRFM